MGYTNFIFLISILLFPVSFITMEVGRHFRPEAHDQRPRRGPGRYRCGGGPVFALFGLLIRLYLYRCGGALRTRRELMVQHTNAIGTAWLRLDLLPAEAQPALRKDLRLYVDEIIKVHQQAGDQEAVPQTITYLGKLQDEIWKLAETAALRDGRSQVAMLVVPALNDMFDLLPAVTRPQDFMSPW